MFYFLMPYRAFHNYSPYYKSDIRFNQGGYLVGIVSITNVISQCNRYKQFILLVPPDQKRNHHALKIHIRTSEYFPFISSVGPEHLLCTQKNQNRTSRENVFLLSAPPDQKNVLCPSESKPHLREKHCFLLSDDQNNCFEEKIIVERPVIGIVLLHFARKSFVGAKCNMDFSITSWEGIILG